jgi:tetratricopeptide (TPR) repeat protein
MARVRRLAGAACCLLAAACAVLPPGAQCRSALGQPLFAPPVDPARHELLARQLAEAQAAHAAAPDDRDAAIWVARRLGYLGRFRAAVDVLTAALAEHPGDPFLLRHRGHRWITLREFGKAAWDLERAAQACRTTADAPEPDGQPTPGRPAHSSLHYNVHYHLGLALFLLRDFELAERAWLACLAVVDDDESRVAVTHWLWCVRMRLGDPAGAAAVVAPIREQMDVVENTSYHELCLLYGGRRQRQQLVAADGSAGAALAFGLAHHDLVTGDRRRARVAFERLAHSEGWAAFGVIAAEVELAHWR